MPPDAAPGRTLGILLASDDPGRVHAAFSMATAGAALGRGVVLLATGTGCRSLAAGDPFDPAFEGRLAAAGVATCRTLRETAVELGARLLACDASVRVEALTTLMPGANVAGMATFLADTGGGQIVSF